MLLNSRKVLEGGERRRLLCFVLAEEEANRGWWTWTPRLSFGFEACRMSLRGSVKGEVCADELSQRLP